MPIRRLNILLANTVNLLKRSLIPAGAGTYNDHLLEAFTLSGVDAPDSGDDSLSDNRKRSFRVQPVDAEDPLKSIPAHVITEALPEPGTSGWQETGQPLTGQSAPLFFYALAEPWAGIHAVGFQISESLEKQLYEELANRLESAIPVLEKSLALERDIETEPTSEAGQLTHQDLETFRIRALYEIVSRPGLSFQGRLREMLHLCSQLTGLELVFLGEPVHGQQSIRILASTLDGNAADSMRQDLSFCSEVIRKGCPVESQTGSYSDLPGAHYSLGIPLRVHGSVTAAFILSTRKAGLKPLSEDRAFLDLVARWISAELEGQRMNNFVDTFFDVSGDMLAILDIRGKALRVNEAWLRTTGYSEEELINLPLPGFISEEDLGAFEEGLEEARDFGVVRGLDTRLRIRGGSHRWISWTIRYDPELNVFFTAARDNTEAHQNELRIIEYNSRLNGVNRVARFMAEDRSIAEIISVAVDALASMFPDYRVCFCTAEPSGTLHVISARTTDAMPDISGMEADLSAAPEYLNRLALGETVRVHDVRTESLVNGIRKNLIEGSTVSLLDVPLLSGDELSGVLCLDFNVPHIWSRHETLSVEEMARALSAAIASQKHKDELVQARNMADAANRAKTEFLANMTHELRTPLHAIIGVSDLLATEDLAPDVKDQIKLIRNSGDSLLGIISTILDLTQIESDNLALTLTDFSLADLIAEVVDQLRPDQTNNDLTLNLDLDSRMPPRVRGDAVRVRQVLCNVVGNAVKFTPAGKVRIRVECSSYAGRLDQHPGLDPNLRSQPVWQKAIIHVEDTGVGISPQKHAEIFDDFNQADNARTRRFGGAGLGLSLSRRLMQKMGGGIHVSYSEPGRGSTFVIEMPLLKPESPTGI